MVLDLFSRKIIGWSLSPRLKTPLIIDALNMAVKQRQAGEKVIIHSDRGSQYASHNWRYLLNEWQELLL